ncbi:hypothetical protein K1T71_000754 [Dendrolimus kikuchii]|uniref:Uncharacterized protein n=1 Tax=Dendrolimus kikuchii TaxID=765133 RepID=A0ACC1DKB4_9NEOP|nr:hypothetical protein K1T71_000754 [Dendrolimus kikuchii]
MWIYYFVFSAIIYIGITQDKEGDECVFTYTNTLGRCKKATECESAKIQSRQNGILPTICSDADPFSGVLICCTDGNNIFQAGNTKDVNGSRVWEIAKETNKRVSEIKCEEYSQDVTKILSVLPLQTEEGRKLYQYKTSKCKYKYSRIQLIIGGSVAEVEEFPHMAAIGYVNFDTYSFLCGGTLISEKFVLTAAHCCTGSIAPEIVRLGDHNLDPSVNDGATPRDVGIREKYVYPDYDSPRPYHDIALLELISDVPFSSGIRPACLWHQDGVGEYTKAIVTGWGITNSRPSSTPSKILKKAALDLFDNDFCDSLLPGNTHFVGFTDSQICAGYLGGGQDTCQGDSGGPLQVTSSENKCIFYVMGVTSLGKSCGDKDTPAIYTRVSSYIEWIEPIVWPK